MKYNFLLVTNPSDVNIALFNIAQEIILGSGIKTDYLVKDEDNLSISHISIVQFELEIDKNNNVLKEIWQESVENDRNKEDVLCILP